MINTSYFWSYFVRPLADVPSILKCLCDEPRLRLGEPLSSDIILSATDKHGNKTGKVRRFVQRHCKPSLLAPSNSLSCLYQEDPVKDKISDEEINYIR